MNYSYCIGYVNALCDTLEQLLKYTVIALLFALLVTVTIQVLGRFILSSPPLWTLDYATLFLVWSIFLGSAVVLRHEKHFMIDIWPNNWTKTIFFLSIISYIIILIILVFFLVDGIRYVYSSRFRTSGMIQLPMIYYLVSLPVGSFFMFIFAFERLLIGSVRSDSVSSLDT